MPESDQTPKEYPPGRPNAGDRIEEGLKYAGQKANEAYQVAGQKAGEAYEQAKVTVNDLYEQGKVKADDVSVAIEREKLRLEREWRRLSGADKQPVPHSDTTEGAAVPKVPKE